MKVLLDYEGGYAYLAEDNYDYQAEWREFTLNLRKTRSGWYCKNVSNILKSRFIKKAKRLWMNKLNSDIRLKSIEIEEI